MFLVNARYLVPKGYDGITIYPFILIRYDGLKKNRVFINHERIHLRQQIELLILPFFIIYILEFVVRLIRYRSASMAYRNISFEREAYQNEKTPDYLISRPFWNFISFF